MSGLGRARKRDQKFFAGGQTKKLFLKHKKKNKSATSTKRTERNGTPALESSHFATTATRKHQSLVYPPHCISLFEPATIACNTLNRGFYLSVLHL